MSKPWNGTSGTQTACLFEVLGPEEAKRFYRGLRDNKIAVVAGNKNVAEGVGVGQYAVGITDTDDAIAEVRKGKPVAIIYPDRDRPKSERMGTLFIPNTLAIIKGCPNPAGARKLVDYLLTPEVEKKLAESDAVQVPLNPNVKAELPPQIRTPAEVKVMDVDFAKAATLWKEANDFVHKEFDQ